MRDALPRRSGDGAPEPPPAALRKAGRARIDAGLKKHGARRHAARANRIIQALTKQTAMVAGTAAADTVRPTRPTDSSPRAPKRADDGSPVMVDSGWLAPRSQRADVAARVETLVRAHPLHRENVTTRPCSPWPTAASPCTP
mgnify:CR=1 FL=1